MDRLIATGNLRALKRLAETTTNISVLALFFTLRRLDRDIVDMAKRRFCELADKNNRDWFR
ncbi:MAG: hypothetical protein ABID61_06020 [Candidatus Micrarchaeota archaeon]